MGDSNRKRNIIIASAIATILVVAAVTVAVVAVAKNAGGPSATAKAVETICASTDHKETCVKSLADANTTDPKELIKLAFDATAKNIGDVLKNSSLLKAAAADPNTKDAFVVCEDVLDSAIDDLRRSMDRIGGFEDAMAAAYAEDLEVWLSAVITYQETCIDAFQNTTGGTGMKMKALLKSAREMSSNGLAMVSDLSNIFSSFNLKLSSSRRLLWQDQRSLLLQASGPVTPTVVVAQDGTGKFRTIKEALDSLPPKSDVAVIVFIKAGLYKEYVVIPKKMNNVMLIGEGPDKTRITGEKNYRRMGIKTFYSATVTVDGMGFIARDIAFENTAGPKGEQAVALRVSGDRAIFYNVNIDGYQDTLYAHNYRQYYVGCTISGTVDFIFGDALALFQGCRFVVRKPDPNQSCMVTAQGRDDPRGTGATIIQNGHIVAAPDFLTARPAAKAYLGRPWKNFSRTIVMETEIDGFVDPTGWARWSDSQYSDTCTYAEYRNRGPGSNTANRVTWKGVVPDVTPDYAEKFTGGKVFTAEEWVKKSGQQNNGDGWIKKAGVPYVPTFINV